MSVQGLKTQEDVIYIASPESGGILGRCQGENPQNLEECPDGVLLKDTYGHCDSLARMQLFFRNKRLKEGRNFAKDACWSSQTQTIHVYADAIEDFDLFQQMVEPQTPEVQQLRGEIRELRDEEIRLKRENNNAEATEAQLRQKKEAVEKAKAHMEGGLNGLVKDIYEGIGLSEENATFFAEGTLMVGGAAVGFGTLKVIAEDGLVAAAQGSGWVSQRGVNHYTKEHLKSLMRDGGLCGFVPAPDGRILIRVNHQKFWRSVLNSLFVGAQGLFLLDWVAGPDSKEEQVVQNDRSENKRAIELTEDAWNLVDKSEAQLEEIRDRMETSNSELGIETSALEDSFDISEHEEVNSSYDKLALANSGLLKFGELVVGFHIGTRFLAGWYRSGAPITWRPPNAEQTMRDMKTKGQTRAQEAINSAQTQGTVYQCRVRPEVRIPEPSGFPEPKRETVSEAAYEELPELAWYEKVKWAEGAKAVGWGAATYLGAVATFWSGAGTGIAIASPVDGPFGELALGGATAFTATRTAFFAGATGVSAGMFLDSLWEAF